MRTPDWELRTPDRELLAPDWELLTLDWELLAPDPELPTPNLELLAPDRENEAPGRKHEAVGRERVSDRGEFPAPGQELGPGAMQRGVLDGRPRRGVAAARPEDRVEQRDDVASRGLKFFRHSSVEFLVPES